MFPTSIAKNEDQPKFFGRAQFFRITENFQNLMMRWGIRIKGLRWSTRGAGGGGGGTG